MSAFAVTLARRRRRRRKRPRGAEWLTLFVFFDGCVMLMVCAVALTGGADAGLVLSALLNVAVVGVAWIDKPFADPDARRGARRILVEWVWGEAD